VGRSLAHLQVLPAAAARPAAAGQQAAAAAAAAAACQGDAAVQTCCHLQSRSFPWLLQGLVAALLQGTAVDVHQVHPTCRLLLLLQPLQLLLLNLEEPLVHCQVLLTALLHRPAHQLHLAELLAAGHPA
jgi:hypothetical protein